MGDGSGERGALNRIRTASAAIDRPLVREYAIRSDRTTTRSLCHGKSGQRLDRRRLEREHDPIFGYARFEEFGGDACFGPIALDPEFAVDEIDMDETTVDTSVLVIAAD